MKYVWKIVWLNGLLLIVGTSCTAFRVTRASTDQVTDLSGRWNDTDSRLVAEKMLEELTDSPWLALFQQTHLKKMQKLRSEENEKKKNKTNKDKKPKNNKKTKQNKNQKQKKADTFIKDLERALIKEGRVRIV